MATLRPLTGARGIVALLVLFFHYRPYIAVNGGGFPGMLRRAIQQLWAHGFVGVDFFFILSGFILTYTYADQNEMRGSRHSFWLSRFARIYPIYLVVFAIGLPTLFWNFPCSTTVARCATFYAGTAIGYLTLTQAWVFWVHSFGIDWAAWTLSVEALCYLLFPVLIVQMLRLTLRRPLADYSDRMSGTAATLRRLSMVRS